MAITLHTCAAMHQGDRAEQQDRVSVFVHPTRPGCMMAVLADGMGGHTGGAMAAEQVVLKARQNFAEYTPATESPEEFLNSVITEAHITIKLTRFTSEKDPHSTAVILLIDQGMAYWAHCGDSRLYQYHDDQLVEMTLDHSYVNDLLANKKITLKQAETHPQRNLLVSCLGAEEEPQAVCSGVRKLERGDTFLLCSDGLWAYFSDEELGQVLSELDTQEAASELVRAARTRAKGYGDNISLAIVKVDEEKESKIKSSFARPKDAAGKAN